MVLDLNTYAVNKKPFIDWYKRTDQQNVGDAISVWATSTQCPCIALAFYISEHIGFTPELISKINGLIKFYNYKEFLNQPSSSPYIQGCSLNKSGNFLEIWDISNSPGKCLSTQ